MIISLIEEEYDLLSIIKSFKTPVKKALKEYYEKHYGWNPNLNMDTYEIIMFHKLLKLFMKVTDDDKSSDVFVRKIYDLSLADSKSDKIDILLGYLLNVLYLDKNKVPRYKIWHSEFPFEHEGKTFVSKKYDENLGYDLYSDPEGNQFQIQF